MKIFALISHTFRELTAKATLLVLAGISTLIILTMLFGLSSKESSTGENIFIFGNPLGPEMPPEKLYEFVLQMQAGLAGGMFTGLVLFGVFATAGIIPDALEKGTVDLYLSKPIARWELLWGKYLGAVVVMLANALYFVGTIWLIFGLKLGVWNIEFLLSAFILTFIFACLYSIVTTIGVAFRNSAISIIGAFLYLFIVSGILYHRETTLYHLSDNAIYHGILDGMYYLLPQLSAMEDGIKRHIIHERIDWKPFVQSFLSSVVFFIGGAALLRKKDF